MREQIVEVNKPENKELQQLKQSGKRMNSSFKTGPREYDLSYVRNTLVT